MVAGRRETPWLTGFPECVEGPEGELGGYVQLPTQLPHVGTAHGDGPGVAEVDLLEGAEREGFVGQVGVGQWRHDVAGLGSEDAQDGPGGGHVGDRHAGVVGGMARDPVSVSDLGREGGHHQEAVVVEAVDGQVGLDAAPVVQPCGVHRRAWFDVHVGRRDPVQHGAGVRSLDEQLGQRGLVEQRRSLPARPMLGSRVLEPVLATECVLVGRLHALGCVPVGSLPAAAFAMAGTEVGQTVVERRVAYTAGRLDLAKWPVHGVQQAESLHGTIVEIAPVGLEGLHASDVYVPQVHWWPTVDHPLGQHLSGTPG